MLIEMENGMKWILNANQSKLVDKYTIEQVKIPSMVLMERAAVSVVSVIKEKLHKTDRILSICGTGGNGGDGIAVARILSEEGYAATILFLGKEENATEDTKHQLSIAKNLGVEVKYGYDEAFERYTVLIDAIFGVGLNREINGEVYDMISRINTCVEQDNRIKVYSVDIPSGVSADTGEVFGISIKAKETITFGYLKLGLCDYPGAVYAGNVTVASIGFAKSAPSVLGVNTFYYEEEDLENLPKREKGGNKGTFGKVLVIAGNENVSGCAYLSAKAAYKTGAGLVKVASATENRLILQSLLPELLFTGLNFRGMVFEDCRVMSEDIEKWSDTLVIGPGIGTGESARTLLLGVLSYLKESPKKGIVVDADAIHILGDLINEHSFSCLDEKLSFLKEILPDGSVLTPHLKELSYLFQISLDDIKKNRMAIAQKLSGGPFIFIMKDARTLVAGQSQVYVNTSGNDGMATGGSGDVLTGILAALIAQGMPIYEASCLSVYLHGFAGNTAKDRVGAYALIASDIIDSLPEVFVRLERE